MPIPISLINDNYSSRSFDLSCLINSNSLLDAVFDKKDTKENKKVVVASDTDASILMDIWKVGTKTGEYRYRNSSNISENDFTILKQKGFIEGNRDNFSITWRGQRIIKHMTLAENNAFLKTKKQKKYTEIMASSVATKKTGYKLASVDKDATFEFESNGEKYKITYEQWKRTGEKLGFDL